MQLLFQSDSTMKKAALFGCPSPGDCYLPVLLSDLQSTPNLYYSVLASIY